jgi:hypothetical protein
MIWNVRVAVIDLVVAASEPEAIGSVVKRLERAGFTVYHDEPGAMGPTAFESDDQSPEVAP